MLRTIPVQKEFIIFVFIIYYETIIKKSYDLKKL